MNEYALLYRSTATRALLAADLNDIAATATTRNAQLGVTGLLLHGSLAILPDIPGGFMQWLEGPETAVLDLFRSIEADPRHTDVETVAEGPIGTLVGQDERLFPGWSMRLVSLAELPIGLRGFLDTVDRQGLASVPVGGQAGAPDERVVRGAATHT